MPDVSFLSHVTIGTNDIEQAKGFYDALLEPLGGARTVTHEHVLGYGLGETGQTVFWVVSPFDRQTATVGNGTHIAFNAATRADVDAFHGTALANGGADEGPPGLRPHYHDNYYGAYVRDLDGNKLQAVCHAPA